VKLYTLIPLVILVLVFVGGYFLAPVVESPESKLARELDVKLELAQRMLNEYNAATPRLEKAFEAAATRPAGEVNTDKWHAYVELAEGTPFAFAQEALSSREFELQQLTQRVQNLGGQITEVSPGGPEEAYRTVLEEVKAGHTLLDQALATVREAINLQEGVGDSEVSGRNNPSATRLEAILLRHKADLHRREAALVRAKANHERKQVERMTLISRDIQDGIAAQRLLLAGGTAPGKSVRAVELPPLPKVETPAPEANAQKTQAESSSSKWWIFGGVRDRVGALKKDAKAAPADAPPPVVSPSPAEEAAPEPAPAVAEAQPEPEAQQGPAEVVPSLPERMAELQKRRNEVAARISQGEAHVAELDRQLADLKARQAAADKAAREAELQMFEAERKAAEASDPEAVQKQLNEYRKLSQAHREAARQAAALKDGAVQNSRSASADPDEIMASPLVPIDGNKPMEPLRGITAIEYDRQVAEKVLAANRELLAEIDRQIAGMGERRAAIEAQVSGLEKLRQQVAAELAQHAEAAVRYVVQADALEQQAIDLAENEGQRAAQQARSAAGDYQRKLADFIRRENPADAPDRKLSEMASDQSSVASAVALQGDLSYLVARTWVQQAADLELHQQMLQALAEMGVAVKLAPEQLPEGVAADAVPAAATSADAAGKAVTEAKQKAAEAGKQALEHYQEAAGQMKDLWAMHANIAAVHNLLADLPRLEGDTEDHLTLARQTYARAIQGREQRPEYAAYRRIMEKLKESGEQASR